MKTLFVVLALCVGLFGLSTLRAQKGGTETLLVLAKGDNMLAVVDPASRQVLARIAVGNDPHEVIASSDGKTAYVSNYGFGAFHTITVVDLITRTVASTIDLGALRGPHGLALAGGKIWFTAEAAKAIGSYDPATKSIDWVFGTGQNRTHMIYVAPDLKRIVTTNVSSGTVSIIETVIGGGGPGGPPPGGPPPGGPQGPRGPMGAPGGDWNQTVVRVGAGSEGFDVSPDGKEIWVANSQDGTVSIVEVAGKKVIETLAADVRGANRLKFTPDGKLAFGSTLGGPDVTVLDRASRKIVRRIPVGHGAAGIVMQPDGSHVFVACSPDGYVAVIGLKTLEVVGHIDVGDGPDGLAWVLRQ